MRVVSRERGDRGAVGFKMFLNLECVGKLERGGDTVRRAVREFDPFAAFVEVPRRYKASSKTSDAAESATPRTTTSTTRPSARRLWYCQLLCGAARGALESVGVRTECYFVKDALVGDPDEGFVMRLTFLENVEDEYPFED